MPQDNILSVKLRKQNGKLMHTKEGMLALYKEFVAGLDEGQIVEVFFTANVENGSNLQLAKIHACIRKLAQETGHTFKEIKEYVKTQAGLQVGEELKSFADCSSAELGLVIEAIIEMGESVNINFRPRLPESIS